MSHHPPVQPLLQAPLGRFRHYGGGEYEVICMARHSETGEELVVYRQLDKDTGFWVRPHAMFFEQVLHEGVRKLRFQKISE
ncbi:DUF1653 domain-containing protein [Herbaspirillum sp. RV1423]|uniref:DUF1653 domain-containing protein n=1 Tax=Herbaspirillum sp. RV1423 TaxID=1443993 RepID=UPI0005596754|nr:DUF1653 domain-containing protein [Herbaspirillum sp. RV1423]